jgi:hypothetical protein
MSEHERTPEGQDEQEETIDDLDVPEEQSGDVSGGFMKLNQQLSDKD